MTYETNTVGPIELQLYTLGKDWFVAISVDGVLCDDRAFGNFETSEQWARAFFADPLKAIRPKPQPEPELDTRYIANMTRVSTGKRVGPKPHC